MRRRPPANSPFLGSFFVFVRTNHRIQSGFPSPVPRRAALQSVFSGEGNVPLEHSLDTAISLLGPKVTGPRGPSPERPM
jgi:hypothetical protein